MNRHLRLQLWLDRGIWPLSATGRLAPGLGLGRTGGAAYLAFLNTSDPQPETGGYLGAAVLAVKTSGLTNVYLTWRAGTLAANSRVYGTRAQYRAGTSNSFAVLRDAQGQLADYQRSRPGHFAAIGPVSLPPSACQQPYWSADAKFVYSVESSTNLVDRATWAGAVADALGNIRVEIAFTAEEPAAFYRLRRP